MSDFEVVPVGTGKVLQRALRELEAGFGGWKAEPAPGWREVAQQALEALDSENPDIHLRAASAIRAALAKQDRCGGENCLGWKADGVTRWVTEAARDAAVQAALAQQAEPVAWIDIEEDGTRHGLRSWSEGTHREHGLYTRLAAGQQAAPTAWRFRTINAAGAVWRLTDDADLIERMRALGHWEIRALVEQHPAPTDTSKEPA